MLQICEMKDLKPISKKKIKIFPKKNIIETKTCIEWDSSSKYICGMASGIVCRCSYTEMRIVHRFNNHSTDIVIIRYSIHKDIDYIVWHPWIETNLLIGCSLPASIDLLDLKTKTTIAHYKRTYSQYMLCAMSINPLSAELVVSFLHEVNGVNKSDILVMASMTLIVDNISAGSMI